MGVESERRSEPLKPGAPCPLLLSFPHLHPHPHQWCTSSLEYLVYRVASPGRSTAEKVGDLTRARGLQVISLALVYGTLTGYPVENPNEPRGLIANISGHLLLFSHETAPECGVSLSSDPDESGEEKSFGPPALLATGVENFWMRSPSDTVRLDRSLDDALWLG